MPELATALYAHLVLNSYALWTNFTGCTTVRKLQIATVILLTAASLRIVLHAILVRRLMRASTSYSRTTHPELLGLYGEAVRVSGVRRRPALMRFPNARPVAFTTGILRPGIFLAPRLVERLDEPELRALLLHELTHVRRRDVLRSLGFQLFVASMPALVVLLAAVHFVTGRHAGIALAIGLALPLVLGLLGPPLRRLNERTCDDRTVALTGDPVGLASSLAQVSRIGGQLPQYAWSSGLPWIQKLVPGRSDVKSRILRLLDNRRPGSWLAAARTCRALFGLMAVGIAAVAWDFHHRSEPVVVRSGCDCTFVVFGGSVKQVPRSDDHPSLPEEAARISAER